MSESTYTKETEHTNVLIIGKSGVGKSSLLNYMFGEDKQPVGTGSPVTEAELREFDYQYDEHFLIRIYDTWGLEPGDEKARQWKNIILDEVRKHDEQRIEDWFNTIIFCLSRNSDRVEDFEIDIVKGLVRDKNHVTIVITHCQSKTDEKAIILRDAMISRLREVGVRSVKKDDFVFVSNVKKKLISGTVEQFGKEDVYAAIIRNVWDSFRTKVPYLAKQRFEESYKREHDRIIDKAYGLKFTLFRNTMLRSFEKSINEECAAYVTGITEEINEMFVDALNYYGSLCRKYQVMSIALSPEDIINQQDFRFRVNEELEARVTIDIEMLRERIGILDQFLKNDTLERDVIKGVVRVRNYLTDVRKIKGDIIKSLERYLRNVHRNVSKGINQVEKQIRTLDVDEIYKAQSGKDKENI